MRKFSLLVLVLALAACRDSNNSGDDTPTPDAAGGGDVTIQEVQNDAMTPGTKVTLKGVVVTAIDNFGMRTGDFWVQEPGGGPYSGVQVYGAPIDQVAALAVGDVVDISGAQKEEFALSSDTSGNTLTELEPATGGTLTVTKTGATMTITPDVVDALAIGQMTDFMARHAEWEKWEGVVVTLNNVAAMSNPECITSMGNCNDTTYERFDVTGDIQVQSALAAMPSSPEVARGDCFSAVTGIVTYFFDYQILPRTTAEIGTGGASCPTENQSATCGDGIDNDGNGFKDCADNACIAGSSSCRTVMTIEQIQTASTPPTGGVELQNVCVAALSRATGPSGGPYTSKNLWVQTSDALATVNNGIFVFGPGTDLGAFTAGKKVNIIGTVKEFNDSQNMGTGTLTEIVAVSVTAGTGTCAPTPILNQDAATLSMDANGEAAESVLVQLRDVKITTAATMSNYYAGTMLDGSTSFKFDDDALRTTDAVNTCYATIVGIWSYQVYDNAWYFLPTQAGMTAGGNCP